MKTLKEIIRESLKENKSLQLSESIHSYIREIDVLSEIAAIETKINETKRAIEERNSKLAEAERLNESGLIDEKKVKQLQKEVALLEKYSSKQESLLEKKRSKMSGKKKEVDDEILDEDTITSEEADMTIDETEVTTETSEEEICEKKEEEKVEPLHESYARMKKLAGL